MRAHCFAAHGVPEHPRQLSEHCCITFDALISPNIWEFKIDGITAAIPVHSRLVVNTAEAAIDAAIGDAGITRVLSYQMENARKSGLLSIALQAYESESVPVSLVFSQQRRLPLKLRAFLDFAAPRLRERL